MTFKKFIEDSCGPGFFPAKRNDPEMNGLARTQTISIKKPSVTDKKKKKDKWDKLFMGESVKDSTAGILFTTGDSILLLKRSPITGHPFTYGLPGGHVKNGETPLQTARRETKEEIGTIIGQCFHKEHDNNWTCFFYKVAVPFHCYLDKEHLEYVWVPFYELKNYELHPKLKKVIIHYINIIEEKFKHKNTKQRNISSIETN